MYFHIIYNNSYFIVLIMYYIHHINFGFQQDPYTMSKGSQLEGYCMDLLTELAKKLGFKYKVHLVKDGAYGRQDESGNWNGMIGEVVRGVCDEFYRKIHRSTGTVLMHIN